MKRTALLLSAAMVFGFPQHGWAGTETIAVTGDQAGGVLAGGLFESFEIPMLNNAGQVSYHATLQTGGGGVDATNNSGIWLDSGLVAREGFQAGDTPVGAVFSSFSSTVLNDAGQVAYEAFLLTGTGGVTSGTGNGIWLDSTLVAREGFQAGGAPAGAVFSGFSNVLLNNAGQVAFSGNLVQGLGGVHVNNNSGVWRDNTLIARRGDQAYGTPAGALFSNVSPAAVNDLGQVGYQGFLFGAISASNNYGLWLDDTLVARTGDQAGDVPAGAVFQFFNGPLQLNNAGQVAYSAGLLQGSGGVTASNSGGIWRDSTLVARTGSQAGGVAAGAVFTNFGDFVINDAGHVAYRANLQTGAGGVNGTNSVGIWRDSTLIARAGSQAAGAPAGAVLNSLGNHVLNDVGQVLYSSTLLQGAGGVDGTNDAGLWIAGTNGETVLVARTGDTLEGRTIAFFTIADDSGGSDGQPRAINNYSQVAYHAFFTNSEQGVFLYTPDLHWTQNFSGGNWDDANNWTLGQLPGDPHDVFIDPAGSVSVFGPTEALALNSLEVGGGTGVARLVLQQGASITAANNVTIASTGVLTGDGVIVGDVTNHGTVNANNITITGQLTNHNLISGGGRINARINNTNGAEIRTSNGERLHILGTDFSSNSGRIEVIGGEIEFELFLSNEVATGLITGRNATMRFNGGMANHGALALSFGTSDLFGDIDNSASGSIVISGGANTTFYDDMFNNGSIVVASAGTATSTAVFFGDVSGAGSITGGGSVFLHGDLRPGNSPAAVNHDVELFLMSTVSTQIELGGTTPGSEHDQINNLKSTTLGGTLDVQLIDGFDPEAGDTFDIFNFASQSGTFSDIVLPTLDAGLGWHLGELYAEGELHVELLGDLNLDGFVGAADLDLLLANWGDSALAFDYAAGDASGDGVVGDADLQLVLDHFGNGTDPGGVVPEPGSLALLALGGCLLMRRRRAD